MKIPIERGDILTAKLASGIDISLCWRHAEGDFRVTVIKMSEHVEHPRHFEDEELARQHAYGLTRDYRATGEEIAVEHIRYADTLQGARR